MVDGHGVDDPPVNLPVIRTDRGWWYLATAIFISASALSSSFTIVIYG